MIFNFENEDETTDENLEKEKMNEEEVKSKLHTFKSEKLCDIIINYRYLGLFRTLYIASMEELAKRRVNGDQFDFEKYIEDNLKSLPKIDLNIKDISKALEQIKRMAKR